MWNNNKWKSTRKLPLCPRWNFISLNTHQHQICWFVIESFKNSSNYMIQFISLSHHTRTPRSKHLFSVNKNVETQAGQNSILKIKLLFIKYILKFNKKHWIIPSVLGIHSSWWWPSQRMARNPWPCRPHLWVWATAGRERRGLCHQLGCCHLLWGISLCHSPWKVK